MLDCMKRIYFHIVYTIFKIYNFFKEKKVVQKPTDPITLLSATKLAQTIRSKEIKSIDIVESYIKRIEEVNEVINAVAYRNYKEAREIAKEIDARLAGMDDDEIEEYCSSRPLLGLPFSMKDSICAKGKVITSGVWNRRDCVVDENAEIVERMLDAGAFLLCITTVPQVCFWIETINPIHGRTNNPYDSRRMVGGSSGGEGALLGAGASLMGIGSDVGGSIRIPSFANGIFGFLTTPGVISVHGHIPEVLYEEYRGKMVRLGPMTRFAEDLELLTKVMSDSSIPSLPVETTLANIRIFYINGLTHYRAIEQMSWQTTLSMKMAVEHFEMKFKLIAHETTLPSSTLAREMFTSSFKSPGSLTMPEMMNCPYGKDETVNCVSELFKFLFGQSHHTLPAILVGLGDSKEPYTHEETEMLFSLRDRTRNGLDELLENSGLLFYPSFPTVAPFHNELLAKQGSAFHSAFWNIMQLPVIQCPMGLDAQGIPTGVMIIGASGSDRLLMKAAQEISNAFGGWSPPGN